MYVSTLSRQKFLLHRLPQILAWFGSQPGASGLYIIIFVIVIISQDADPLTPFCFVGRESDLDNDAFGDVEA